MLLSNIDLSNPIDNIRRQEAAAMFREMTRVGRIKDGKVEHAVNTIDGDFVKITTRGEEEYVLFCVFVAKIRRENEDFVEQTPQKQREWYEMAQAFIAKFGVDHTPPDIVEEFKAVKAHLGL